LAEESAEPNARDAVAPGETTPPLPVPHQYWLRVHGYPSDLSNEVVYYNDFFDLREGVLASDPTINLRPHDVIIYYADGPSIVYGVATVTGEVEGPLPDPRRGQRWIVPIRRELLIRAVDKSPPAATLAPPSGRHFLARVRDATYIRLPDEDGEYLIAQVKSRAGPTKAAD